MEGAGDRWPVAGGQCRRQHRHDLEFVGEAGGEDDQRVGVDLRRLEHGQAGGPGEGVERAGLVQAEAGGEHGEAFLAHAFLQGFERGFRQAVGQRRRQGVVHHRRESADHFLPGATPLRTDCTSSRCGLSFRRSRASALSAGVLVST